LLINKKILHELTEEQKKDRAKLKAEKPTFKDNPNHQQNNNSQNGGGNGSKPRSDSITPPNPHHQKSLSTSNGANSGSATPVLLHMKHQRSFSTSLPSFKFDNQD